MTKNANSFINIENAAHTGAFGENSLPVPTDAQCMAGNYKLGRTLIYGLPVAIEQPRHSYRTGLDQSGKRWTSRLAAHYGYFSGTRGADGDAIDCFIGVYPQAEYVYVINQYVKGSFDEHKVMLCFMDEESARLAYAQSYDKGWTGLHDLTIASISQLKWWLKYGNHKNPLLPNQLPYEGLENMNQQVTWDNNANPHGMSLDKLLYEIRRADSGDNLLMDSVSMADILEDTESVMMLDALVTPYAKLQRKMDILKTIMERAGGTIKPEALQVSDPFKQNGVAQVAVIFELSDGQTISIFFHNPDIDPKKITPTDELISWKWLLNRKDITVVVAPEKGVDLNVKVVAERIIKLAEKNSAAFKRANVNRAAKMQVIEDIKTEIVSLETELKDAQHELEVAKVEAEDKQHFVDLRMQRRIQEAALWKGATMQVANMIGDDKKQQLALMHMTTKADLDAYLMHNFTIDESSARDVSNALTAQDIPADMSANLDDYKDEPWYSLIPQAGVVDPEPIIEPEVIEPSDEFYAYDVAESDGGFAATFKNKIIDGGFWSTSEEGVREQAEEVILIHKNSPYIGKTWDSEHGGVVDVQLFGKPTLGDGSELYEITHKDGTILRVAAKRMDETIKKDEILATPEGQKDREDSRANFAAQQEAIEKAKELAEAKINSITERIDKWLSSTNYTPMQKGAATAILLKQFHYTEFKLNLYRAEFIENRIEAGDSLDKREEDKIKDKTNQQLNRMSGDEQNDYYRKKRESGTKTVYRVGNYDVTKSEYDYANYLISTKPQETNEQTNEQTEITPEDETAGTEGGIDENQANIDTLQSIIDGQHDAIDLAELLDMIDKAATALIDAGLGDANDSIIGAAADKYAALDLLKYGN